MPKFRFNHMELSFAKGTLTQQFRDEVRDWIEAIYYRREDLEGEALASLIRQGILRHEKSKRFWVIDVERFPLIDNQPQRDVRQRVAEAGLKNVACLAVMDAERLGFADAFFDVIVAQYVITAVPNPDAVLTEFARVTKPGRPLMKPVRMSVEP